MKSIRMGIILLISVLQCQLLYGSEVSYYVYDAPGRSVSAIIDSSAQVINKYSYNVFGDIYSVTGSVGNEYNYTGERFDPQTALIYLRKRYYDPEVGRLITKDPLKGIDNKPQTLNPYAYCVNNPVNFTDPNGDIAPLVAYLLYVGASGLFSGATDALIGAGMDFAQGKDWNTIGSNALENFKTGFITGAAISAVLPAVGSLVSKLKYGRALEISTEGGGKIFQMRTPGVKGLEPWYRFDFHSLSQAGPMLPHWHLGPLSHLPLDPIGTTVGAITNILTPKTAYGDNTMSANYGGVSLSKTASLLTDLTEIKGAFYDDKTGQIILVGKQNVSLPEMKLDDLAVAANSVYAGTDPGVSIDPPLVNNQFTVRYDGKTTNTEFGYTMFESDRIMKTLAMGKDNITGNPVTSSVTGYKNLLDRFRENNSFPEGESSHRFWFKPKEMKLVKSSDGNSFVFDTSTMECLTESKYQSNVVGDPQSEAFAQNLTDHYDDYANERPVFKDLKRLGQVVSVVKWIKDNDIPIDLSFISNYNVPAYSTPANTPATTVSTQWQDGQIIRTLTITGGVTYTKPNEYLTDNSNATDPLKTAAINQRPSETNFKWGFISPQSESLTAVAESFARSRKDGNLSFSATDLSYPADCDFALAFARFYDSFYEKSSALGYGWEYRPYQIRFPDKKQTLTFGSSNLQLSLYAQLFVIDRYSGQEGLYELLGIDSNNLPLYVKAGQAHILREMPDTTLVLTRTDNTIITFDNKGNLILTTDKNAKSITYTYDGNGKLASINAGSAGSININYSGDHINSVTGPGPRTINYGFDNGNLTVVTNAESQVTHYEYDGDHRIRKIVDARNNEIFTGVYDDYNRLVTSQINQELNFNHNFNLNQRSTIETDPNLNNTAKTYDDKYRVTGSKDHLGNSVSIAYDGDFGPKEVVGAKGDKTQYTYDVHGNVSSVTQPDGGLARLYYDQKDNLIAATDPEGIDTAYAYDDNNRLSKIYHSAILNLDAGGNLTGWQYDPANVTIFNYDAATGHLLSITNPENRQQIFDNYNANGIPRTVKSSSGFAINNVYDSLSRLKSINDPAGNNISFEYTNADRIKSVTTSAGTSWFDYDENNNLKSIKDANENITTFDYDAKNNLQSVTDPELGATSYTYDKFGNLTGVTLPNNGKLGYEFDEIDRLVLANSGMGTPTSVIALLDDAFDVGAAVLGSSTSKALTVYNIGTKDLTISNISSDNGVFAADSGSAFIPPGSDFTFNVIFTPAKEGQDNAILTILSDDPDSPALTVNLTGSATLPSIAPQAISSGNGVSVNWQKYDNSTSRFNHYSVYRSTSPITSITGLTAIASITDIATTQYSDTTAVMGTNYYYTVIAFDSGANKLTAIESFGPIAYLDLGRIALPAGIETLYKELNSCIVYNSAQKEYLVVYEYDVNGNGANYDIYGQRIDGNGAKVGSAFAIFNTSYNEKNARVVFNKNANEYMAVAEYDSNGSGAWRIRAQKVSVSGSLVGSPIDLLSSSNPQNSPSIAYGVNNNRYAVVFECDYSGIGRKQFIVLILDSAGGFLYGKVTTGGSDSNLRAPVIAYNASSNEYLAAMEYTNNSTYSYITGLRLDNAGATLGGILTIAGFSNKSARPKLIYNPDRNEYACIMQYDYNADAKTYIVIVGLISAGGTVGSYSTYSISGSSMTMPDIAYYKARGEYIFTFTRNFNTTEYDVLGQRIFASTLGLVTVSTIPVATSVKPEKNNCIVNNLDKEEFLATYEYDANGDGSNYDVKVQRIGILTTSCTVTPSSLDFGAIDTRRELKVYNNVGNAMQVSFRFSDSWVFLASLQMNSAEATAGIGVNRVGLAPGNYFGNIHLSFISGAADIPVTMSMAAQAPNTPDSPSPADGATDQADVGTGLTVTMRWSCTDNDVGDSLIYDVYFSDDSNKVNNFDAFCKVSTGQAQASYKSAALQFLKTYYWRVAAKDKYNLSANSPVWRFTTAAITPPQLIAYTPDPTNNTKPALAWNVAAGASKYHLQVSNSSVFSSLLVDNVTLAGTSYTMAADLPAGKIYWRVSSKDAAGNESVFSDADDFTVDITAPSAPVLIAYTPDPTREQKPDLKWNAVSDAASYRIQISDSSNFNNLLTDKAVTSTGFTPAGNLPEGNIYWRVSSKDAAGNESAFSDFSEFRIDITPPAKISGLSAAVTKSKVILAWNPFSNTDNDFGHFNIYRSDSAIANVSGMIPISKSITGSSVITFTDTSVTEGVKYYYAVTAEDVLGNEDKAVTAIGPVTPQNQAPVLGAIGNKNVNEGQLLEFTVSAADPDNDALVYSVTGLPRGAYFSPAKKIFSWLPDYDQAGSYTVHFEVADGSLTDYEDITITVNNSAVNSASGKTVNISLKVRVVQ